MIEPRSLTILNNQGHFTFVWSDGDDSLMEKIIQSKIKQGIVFFVTEPLPYKKLVPSVNVLKEPDDIVDAELRAFVLGSYAEAVATQNINMKNVTICRDPKIISQSQSLAVKPLRKERVNVTQ